MSFSTIFQQFHWDTIKQKIYSTSETDVVGTLKKIGKLNTDDFITLLSPAASVYLDEMIKISHQQTVKRFGKTIQMYVPLYLSNECHNICTYCGFSQTNNIKRITLDSANIQLEIKEIKKMGYNHILLVTGESAQVVGIEYFEKVMPLLNPHFSHISMEVQPLEEDEYRKLISLGLHAVLIYQETYNQDMYKKHHPKGRKSNFSYRLETPDRLGKAGILKIGLGSLIGLEDWRTDAWFTALHLRYLQKNYWKTKYSISFPRLRPAEGVEINSTVTDLDFMQLITAFRIFDETLELSLSTRESPEFRDQLIGIGITSMSAGSKTNPGGYSFNGSSLEQFEVSDERSAAELADVLHKKGYEPVWKDWF